MFFPFFSLSRVHFFGGLEEPAYVNAIYRLSLFHGS